MSIAINDLRVALVTGSLTIGGSEKQAFYTCKALRQAGAVVHVFCTKKNEYFARELTRSGFPLHDFGAARLPLLRLLHLVGMLRDFKPDVIQSVQTFTNLYVGIAGRLLGVASVGSVRTSKRHLDSTLGKWVRPALHLPDALLVNSVAAARSLRSGRLRSRLVVIPNVIEPPAVATRCSREVDASEEEESATVVGIGRFIAEKRFDRWLTIMSRVADYVPRVKGVLVGDGPERSALESQARELGIMHSLVTFVGMQSDISPFLKDATVLLHTADEEGFPNVLMEAMAFSRPVVSTPAGDAGKLIQKSEGGLVIPPDDLDEASKIVAEIVSNPSLATSMGMRGRGFIEKEHSFDALVDTLSDLYVSLGLGSAFLR